ncbi:MAG: aminopeptidase, partial [Ruminococcus sp.]|nr:aminopeptidase [Ruminococcus sp.]
MSEEKSKTALLKEELMMGEPKGVKALSAEEIKKADEFCEGYKKFLNASPVEREAVIYSVEAAKKAGFTEFDPNAAYKPGDRVYLVNRNKALALAVIGKNGVKNGARLAIAHIDSPRIDLKPNPLYEANNLALFKTHYYGGLKKYQWTAIPLTLHGTVVKLNGEKVDICWGDAEDESCFCVTDLLPHLAQEQVTKPMAKAFTGEDLNVLVGSRPFDTEDKESDLVKLNVVKILNDKYGITEKDFLSAELCLVPSFKAKDIGFDSSMIGGYGHDDKVCAYPALMAAIDVKEPEQTCITYLADKEEIGSEGNTGMQCDFLRYFIADLARSAGLADRDVIRHSTCISADVNAGFDPTFPDVVDKHNCAFVNKGVCLTKYTGSGGKGGSNDASAEFINYLRRIYDKEGVLWQIGELGKTDLGGGGTVAKYVAKLDIETVDLG